MRVSWRITNASPSATNDNPACTKKRVRHPRSCTSGPPATRPNAGAAAPVIDHQPIARTRSSPWCTLKIKAMAVGMVAAPTTAETLRKAINEPTSQAIPVIADVRVAAAKPSRKTRRWP